MHKDFNWGPLIGIAITVAIIAFSLWVGSQPDTQPDAAEPMCSQYGNC